MSTSPRVPGHWRSLQELAASEDFRRHLEAEFPTGIEPPANGLSRRRFLQIMAASAAMASLTGCRWPEEKIVPFAKQPAGTTPGETRLYATAMELGGVAVPLLATSYDGRPIKIDGNPDHPASLGGASAIAQASVLDLYDVDRSRTVVRRDGGREIAATWDDFAKAAAAAGRNLCILAEPSLSPSRRRLQDELQQAAPQLRWFEHDPVDDRDVREGAARAFGGPHRDVPWLEHAKVIGDFDANLLHDHPLALRNARMFARGRRPVAGQMNRLYVFEPVVSPTGVVADHRQPTAAVDVPFALAVLAGELFVNQHLAVPAGAGFSAADLGPWAAQAAAHETLRALAADLLAHRGAGLVAVGSRQPAGAHHLAHVINAALGNAGTTVTYQPLPAGAPGLAELADALAAGQVETLVILGGNPVATAPADVDFAAALGRARTSIHLSGHQDATSRRCTWHVPRAHYLESWGDAVAGDGSVVAVQPLIEPLFGGRSDLELLACLLGNPAAKGHDVVRASFHQREGGLGEAPRNNPRFEERWRVFLHDGFLPAAGRGETPALAATAGLDLPRAQAKLSPENLELIIKADPCLHDGRFADNAWLQELPDFATKLAWDNVASLSPATAAALHVEHGDLLELSFQGRAQLMPCYVLPGHAANSVSVTLGYGREDAGRVGRGVGHDAYRLRSRSARHGGVGLTVRRTGKTYPLACTQDHHAIDPIGYQERERRVGSLVHEGTLEHYTEHPDFVDHLGLHHPPLVSLWDEKEYTGHKWGMSIDLSVCIGCNACVMACQAENNIPVVGKVEVGRSREMHWLRIDRYFQGDPENPRVAAQPIACAHCEMAPCEGVCPVAATVHTEEGLNAMAYNRCVGTRYCANNCPYKVRRFNWFNNQDKLTETGLLVLNPEVTVRSRGVMEKCTYCVQRIQNAKIKAKGERRPLADGEITPACAQTCPTEAIVFGDLNDRESRVAKLREDKRSYDLLAFLNIKPRTHFMARIRNPHAGAHDDQNDGGHGGGHDHGA